MSDISPNDRRARTLAPPAKPSTAWERASRARPPIFDE
jgi:hypothetical protein